MKIKLEELDISGLSVQQKIDMIGKIWDSIDADSFRLTPEQWREIERRAAESDARGDQGLTWPEVKRRLQERS